MALRLIGKGLGGKKIYWVNVSLTNKQSFKLNRLATACNMKPTALARMLIDLCLNNVELVDKLQQEFCTQTSYRVVLVNNGGGELVYLLNGREEG